MQNIRIDKIKTEKISPIHTKRIKHKMNRQTNSLSANKKLRPFLVLFLSILLLSFSGCSNSGRNSQIPAEENSYISKSDFLLNTVVTINLYDKQEEALLDDCFDLIAKYENIFSRTSESSELYALNHGTAPHKGLTYQISDELSDILSYGLYYSDLTKGAFDITVEPITSLWDFTAEEPVLPDQQKLLSALQYVNYKNLQLKDNEVTLANENVGIDLGAIAKGYIADRVKEFLISKGVQSAMINLGGNVLCVGEKPDGTAFHVGIQKPYADRNETIAVMDINDLSVVSSGVYERYFTLDGISYHHILNPETGYPYKNGLISVTIISKESVDGDGLSTSCFALGLEKGLALIAGIPDTYAVFITEDYEIHYSEGFETAISIIPQE